MANDLNRCEFIGRLGRDVETRTFPSGDQVANIRLAVGSKWKSKETGELKESTEWVSVTFNGKLAEVAATYLVKGSQIYVSGQLRTRTYEQNGEKKYATEIRADTMQMLGGKQDGQSAPAPAPQRQRAASAPRQGGSTGFEEPGFEDSIPFISASASYDMTTSRARRMARYEY